MTESTSWKLGGLPVDKLHNLLQQPDAADEALEEILEHPACWAGLVAPLLGVLVKVRQQVFDELDDCHNK